MRKTSRRPAPNQLPIPWHVPKKVCHHWALYRLTCEQFDAMHWRAQGRCEICAAPQESLYKRRLYIDHDNRLGTTYDHVRGLICAKCNRAMAYVDNGYRRPTPEQMGYIERAWYRVFVPPKLRDEHYTPPQPRNPSCSAPWKTTPAYIRGQTVGWVFAPHPNERRS